MKLSTSGIVICLLAALLFVSGCGQKSETPEVNSDLMKDLTMSEGSTPKNMEMPGMPPADMPFLTVNGTPITHGDLQKQMSLLMSQGVQVQPQRLMSILIGEVLLSQAAEENGIVVSESEIQEVYDGMVANVSSEEMFLQQVAMMGDTVESLKEDISRQISVKKVIDWKTEGVGEVSDASIEAFFNENIDSMESVEASHILIAFQPNSTDEEKTEAKSKLEKIKERIEAGEDFGEIAKVESDDPGSGAKGGSLGEFGRGRMVPPFEEAAFSTEPGTLSDIVESQFGYHLIFVEKHNEPNMEESREQIRGYISDQEKRKIIDKWINELQASAEIVDSKQTSAPGAPHPPMGMPGMSQMDNTGGSDSK